MTAPFGTQQDLAIYLQDIENRISVLELAGSPVLVFACLKANLPDPVSNINRVARVTDTNILVASDGIHWINQSTGAPI